MSIRCDFTACAKSTHANLVEAREAHRDLQVTVTTTVTERRLAGADDRPFPTHVRCSHCKQVGVHATYSDAKECAQGVGFKFGKSVARTEVLETGEVVTLVPATNVKIQTLLEAQPLICMVNHRSVEAQARCKKGIHAS